jgi:hypothetical protein
MEIAITEDNVTVIHGYCAQVPDNFFEQYNNGL